MNATRQPGCDYIDNPNSEDIELLVSSGIIKPDWGPAQLFNFLLNRAVGRDGHGYLSVLIDLDAIEVFGFTHRKRDGSVVVTTEEDLVLAAILHSNPSAGEDRLGVFGFSEKKQSLSRLARAEFLSLLDSRMDAEAQLILGRLIRNLRAYLKRH
jgi:hypothetical protein